ncbi:MAG: hypothetical protein HQQ73_02080 [Desulfobulbaceae bacterium]|nr:hypothetical protein [Desulfobulbaceae bacterium]
MNENKQLVRRILALALFLALLIALGGWIFSGMHFALSVLVGAVLACGSFFLLQRDVRQLMDRLASDNAAGGAISGMEKARFMVKSLGRFTVLALLLFAIATRITIQPLGLVLGLATIMLSVVLIGVVGKRKKLSGIP